MEEVYFEFGEAEVHHILQTREAQEEVRRIDQTVVLVEAFADS